MEAFESAFKKGAQGIELDVHLNNDQIIVVHDFNFDKNKKYLLLETVLEKFGQKGFIEIEYKGFEIKFVEKAVKLIKKYHPLKFEITSSVLPILPYVRELFPKANIGAIFKPYLFESYMTKDLIWRLIVGYMHLTKANVSHLYPKQFDKSLINYLQEKGFKVHGHIYSDQIEEYNKIVSLGFDKATFDKITLLEKIYPQ